MRFWVLVCFVFVFACVFDYIPPCGDLGCFYAALSLCLLPFFYYILYYAKSKYLCIYFEFLFTFIYFIPNRAVL